MPSMPGVGVLFNPALDEFVQTHGSSLDYVSVIPDRSWVDNGPGSNPRFEDLELSARLFKELGRNLPMVMHCLGLSICSADIFDREYLGRLAQWRDRHDCAWVSEHLSFSRISAGHETNAAMALPSPYDRELLDLLVPRIKMAQDKLGCPFLLENNVYYFDFPDQEMTETEFLNQLVKRTGCGLLLDLHNLHTNAVNHGFEARTFLENLDLAAVQEIHIAGGISMMGFHTDSHTGAVIDPVWDLLDFVAPKTPALRGVTFEFHESTWPQLRTKGLLDQLARAREALTTVCVA